MLWPLVYLFTAFVILFMASLARTATKRKENRWLRWVPRIGWLSILGGIGATVTLMLLTFAALDGTAAEQRSDVLYQGITAAVFWTKAGFGGSLVTSVATLAFSEHGAGKR